MHKGEGPDVYFPKRETQSENIERRRPSRYEQEQKIKKGNSVKKFVAEALIVGGILIGSISALHQFNKEDFMRGQENNIEKSSILKENNIDQKDIIFKDENTMSFSIDNVDYELSVDTRNIEGLVYNADGGIYEGKAVYEEGNKIITKTFEAKDKEDDGNSWNKGISIDKALTELGYTPKNQEM